MLAIGRLHPRRATVLVVAAAVLLSACGGDESSAVPQTAPADDTVNSTAHDGTARDDAAPTANATATEAAAETATATSTEILTAVLGAGSVIGGQNIDLDAVDGRPVVAWFWAPWCTICRAEGPTVGEVAATYRDDVVLIGVPGRGADDDMQRFIDDTATRGIAHVADFDGSIWSQFGVFAQPAFACITADGDVEFFVGSLGERALIERIEALVDA
ncbi:protein disulfide oxidoreductase [soil metagenome]